MADVKRDEEMGGDRFLFATFDVTRQGELQWLSLECIVEALFDRPVVFFKSRCSIGIVNLKPLKPGRTSWIPLSISHTKYSPDRRVDATSTSRIATG